MAAMLLCKRTVSQPNLCRSVTGHDSGRLRPLKERLMLHELDNWCKKKNPWVDDGNYLPEPRKIKWYLTDNSRLRTEKQCESDTSDEKGMQCYVTNEFYPLPKPGEPLVLRLRKMDFGPHAYADGHRTLAYNQYIRAYLSIDLAARRISRSFLTDMIVNGAIPDVVTFSILIRYYCRYFKYQFILDVVYKQMKALGVEANDTFCQNLIYGVCPRFGASLGFQLLKELRSDRGIQMPLSCYDAVVRQFCRKKTSMTSTNARELIDVLMHMKQERHFPDDKICDCLIKGQRYHSDESFIQAAGIGRRMFGEGLKIGVISGYFREEASKDAVNQLCT